MGPPASDSAPDDRERGIVQKSVRRERVIAVGPRDPTEVREPPAGLLDDDPRRGEIPELGDRLARDIDGALREERVGPEVAKPARAPAALRQVHEPRAAVR